MQVSVFPSVLLVLRIKPRWVALMAHAFAIVGFCSLSVISSVTYSYTEIFAIFIRTVNGTAKHQHWGWKDGAVVIKSTCDSCPGPQIKFPAPTWW